MIKDYSHFTVELLKEAPKDIRDQLPNANLNKNVFYNNVIRKVIMYDL